MMEKAKEKLVVILGPTATGKSHCAIEVARRLNGEIISGDSMLVYRHMDIGTAKPTAEELSSVPHHLVNILPPEADFNVTAFKEQAECLITEITSRGRLPIIAGGTGLYIKALLENYAFNSVGIENETRSELEAYAEKNGKEALHKVLEELDADAAARLHVNDVRRVIRAIEVAQKGEAVNQYAAEEMPYDALVFGLNMERQFLYERINKRVDKMLDDGLENEVRSLLAAGVPEDAQSMKSIGYRQMLWYINGQMPYAEAVDKLKQATRNFAKRQVTWYKRMPYIKWVDIDERLDYDAVISNMCLLIKNKWNM